jgi:hypothetical protein
MKLFAGMSQFELSFCNNEPNSASQRGWLFQILATTVRNHKETEAFLVTDQFYQLL